MIELKEYIENQVIINTHSHHLTDKKFIDFNLERLLAESYISWWTCTPGESSESRKAYLEKVQSKSYFVWLHKALNQLYRVKLSPETWEEMSARIRYAHKDHSYHMKILSQICGYYRIILDNTANPGSDQGHPEIFVPTYRVGMFLFGYCKETADHNGNNPVLLYNREISHLAEYVRFLEDMIQEKMNAGCVALKSAIAYDRKISFELVSPHDAEKIFQTKSITSKDIIAFQDYVFHEICRIAAELNLPLQCHTGLGLLDVSNALQMRSVIELHPHTRFVLFHIGYPWLDDVFGLVHKYSNVYTDLCWLPIISQTAAERALHELIEVSTADKICWGCDTWTSEESLGALLAFRHVLHRVLREKVKSGYFNTSDAKYMAKRILYNNACELYSLSIP